MCINFIVMIEFRVYPEGSDRLSREIAKLDKGNMYHDWYDCRVTENGLHVDAVNARIEESGLYVNAINCVESISFFIPKSEMPNFMAKKLYR